jgi:hypothetical protein
VVSPRCRGWHRFVSGNVRVASQAGWRGLQSLGRCPCAVGEGWMATGSPPRSSPAAWRTTRSPGCGWKAPSSEPIASFRHVATNLVAPRVHAGVVHAWPRQHAPAQVRWLASTGDGGIGPRRTAEPSRELLPCGGDGAPWSANLGLLEPAHPAMAPGGGNGRPIGRSAGVVRCATRRPTSSSGESGSRRANSSPQRDSGSRSAGGPRSVSVLESDLMPSSMICPRRSTRPSVKRIRVVPG